MLSYRNCRIFLLLLFAASLGCIIPSNSAQYLNAQATGTVDQYLVEQVCLNSSGNIKAGTPYDSTCTSRRQATGNDYLLYHLKAFPAIGSSENITLDNVWVTQNNGGGNVTRSVTYFHRAHLPVATDVSIQGYDSSYGTIMGSWSPGAFSTMNSPNCNADPNSSNRFQEGWVLGSKTLPALGVTQYGTFEEAVLPDPYPTNGINTICPAGYQHGFTAWVVMDIAYQHDTSTPLQTLHVDHFSHADSTGLSPGDAEQLERSLWTREFGLTRWEKWSRSDYIDTAGRTAQQASIDLYASQSCSMTPVKEPADVSPGLVVGDIISTASNGTSEVFRDPRSGVRYTWYLTLCEDYTDIVSDSGNTTIKPGDGFTPDPIFWNP